MDRARILEKIQKCFALSKSSNAGEAANALRQAQKMIEIHDVGDAELGAVGYGNEKVSVPIQANVAVPASLGALIKLIKGAFGVNAVVEREMRVSDYSFAVRYFGPNDRIMLAGYAHTVVFTAMNAAWTQHLKENPQYKGRQGARAGFLLGWLDSVRATVEELGKTESEIIGTDLAMSNYYGRGLAKVKANKISVSGSTMKAGGKAGQSFRLHRPISAGQLKIGVR